MRSRTAIVVVALAVGLAPGIAGASSAGEPKRHRVALVRSPSARKVSSCCRRPGSVARCGELPVEGTHHPARAGEPGQRPPKRRPAALRLHPVGADQQFAPLPTVAREFPDTWFATLDASRRDAPVRFPGERSRRLVPRAGDRLRRRLSRRAGMERQRDRPGRRRQRRRDGCPPVVRFIAGFPEPALRQPTRPSPERVCLELRRPRGVQAAANGVIAKGAGVVFQVAGQCGVGVLEAAAEHGCLRDRRRLRPVVVGRQVLTSAVKRFDLGVYRAIQLLVQGGFRPGDTSLGIADRGACPRSRSARGCRPTSGRKTRRVLGQIARGEIRAIPRPGRLTAGRLERGRERRPRACRPRPPSS